MSESAWECYQVGKASSGGEADNFEWQLLGSPGREAACAGTMGLLRCLWQAWDRDQVAM